MLCWPDSVFAALGTTGKQGAPACGEGTAGDHPLYCPLPVSVFTRRSHGVAIRRKPVQRY